jgi:hypothetical protein
MNNTTNFSRDRELINVHFPVRQLPGNASPADLRPNLFGVD